MRTQNGLVYESHNKKTYKMMLVVPGTGLKKMPIDLRDTDVHGVSFENLPSRQIVYNASRAFRNRGSTIGALGAQRTMTTADDMKNLERFVTTMDTFVHDLDGHNWTLAVNLRESRETEHRLRVFVLLKVSLHRMSEIFTTLKREAHRILSYQL